MSLKSIKHIKSILPVCASVFFIFLFSFFNSATAQSVGYTDHSGRVVDAETGKPIPNATVTHALGGQSDEKGRFTVRFYNNESDRRVIISHSCYYPDTFSYAPTFVSLRRLPTRMIQPDRPRVAVVLSGGGAKGVAHISALKAIEKAGIPIDIITGTSMGALIGGLYSIGWSTDELDSLVRHQDWTFLLTDRVKSKELDIDSRRLQSIYPLWHAFTLGSTRNEGAGFIRGVNLDHLFDKLLEGYHDSIDFNNLPIAFACVATDIVTNKEIDFHSGYLKQAMRASMSIPGVFSPVRMGDMVLVDGGMRNNYPADIAREMGADIIIGVSVQGDTLTADDITGPVELLMQIVDINCKNKYNDNLAMSDILMQVDVDGYSAASFTAASIDALLHRGEEAAVLHQEELNNLHRQLVAQCGELYSSQSLSRSVSKDSAENHGFKLTSTNPTLFSPVAGVTFRFDNEETGALQLGARYPFVWITPMEASARLRLGKRLQFEIAHQLFPQGFTSPSISYSFHRNDIDIYDNGVRTYNVKYSQHIVQFTPINSRFLRYKINAGLRFDYYNFNDPILSSNTLTIDIKNQRFLSYFFQSLLNTENDYYFPTAGNHFQIDFAYHTDNFVTFNNKAGIPDLNLLWRINLSPIGRLTLQPGLFSRLILSDHMPLAYINVLGTEQQIVEQQIAFPGVHSLVQVDRYLVGINFNLQYLIAPRHYLLIHSAAGRQSGDMKKFLQASLDLTDSQFIHGLSIGYAYHSFLGPVSAHLGYSSLAPDINFYLSIGHRF